MSDAWSETFWEEQRVADASYFSSVPAQRESPSFGPIVPYSYYLHQRLYTP
ncbi:MAG: hypothetical protein ACI8UD_001864 [Planctomycetota bacterium]|jgi:hypothetical protein